MSADRDGRQEAAYGGRVATTAQVEVVVAGLLAALALLVLADSWRVGTGWAAEGPQAGFFPFYVGLVLLASAGVTLVAGLRRLRAEAQSFVDRVKLGRVLSMLVPAVVYVGLVSWLGIYVASALLILFFMQTHGEHLLLAAIGVALGLALVLYVFFELWFLLPLPKGPLEDLLGL